MSHPPALNMFGLPSAQMPFTAGPSFQMALMSRLPAYASTADVADKTIQTSDSQPSVSQATTTSLDSSNVKDSDDEPDVPHRSYQDYEPGLPRHKRRKMITQNSRVYVPYTHPTHDLAFFLRTTGPGRNNTVPSRAASTSKSALRFFKLGKKHDPQLVLYDEGGLTLPDGVQQKVSVTGKKYLALTVKEGQKSGDQDSNLPPSLSEKVSSTGLCTSDAPVLDASILDSHVSINFTDDLKNDRGSIPDWYCNFSDGGRTSPVSPISVHLPATKAGAESTTDSPAKQADYSPSPIRPPASSPPTPQPHSATSLSESYRSGLTQHPAKSSTAERGCDPPAAEDSPRPKKPATPMPVLPLPHEEFPVKVPRLDREAELKHPSPLRVANHTLLLAHEDAPVSGSNAAPAPGTPPPKSPLRLRRDARTIGQVLLPSPHFDSPPMKQAPVINSNAQIIGHRQTIVPTVTTECTGPLTRTNQYKYTPVKHHLYPMSRKEREEKTRARKLRDRPQVHRTIDTVCTPIAAPKQRLKKARPSFPVPGLVPAPLSTRTASVASSDISWQCIDDAAKVVGAGYGSPRLSTDLLSSSTPASVVRSSLPRSSRSIDAESKLESSPVTLIAEEVALAKVKPSPRARLVVSRERMYTPRPRSASMPRLAGKRLSRASYCEPSRIATPDIVKRPTDDMSDLPSPPPTRALPPTPPASGSEGLRRKPVKNISPIQKSPQRELPFASSYESWPQPGTLPKTRQSDVLASLQERRVHTIGGGERLGAYVEALEEQNRLLRDAMRSMLLTSGASNTPLAACLDANSPKSTMSWESRVNRRSEASHAASSSNGSALDMYMNTRSGATVVR